MPLSWQGTCGNFERVFRHECEFYFLFQKLDALSQCVKHFARNEKFPLSAYSAIKNKGLQMC